MSRRTVLQLVLFSGALVPVIGTMPAPACCPAGRTPVVNADQTVIILWDAAAKMQHFIRQASFKSDADDFGFLVPSPTEPALESSGNDAFPYLLDLTKPEVITQKRPTSGGGGCGCAASRMAPGDAAKGALPDNSPVTVLQDKVVAGFRAKVLETSSAAALVGWLKENGYLYSPEVEAWAKPYVEQGWKITALRVEKDKEGKASKDVATNALRLSFKTDRPVFPYREPDYKDSAKSLGASRRLLRIYFVAEARYQGELTKDVPWTGTVAWANSLSAEQRAKALELLHLPETTGPASWWLTEFEDRWPYRVMPADVYFAPDADQSAQKRPPIIIYVSSPWPADGAAYALAAALVLPPLIVRWRRRS
jgi:hypothetical protein